VIYLHGNSSSRIEGLNLISVLLPYDISLVLIDFAGCGMSEGEYISLGYFEKFDAGLVIDHVRKLKQITTFGVWGRSMGASTAI
jgi:pimeloyl-ACP methyl ester carboxylesterase